LKKIGIAVAIAIILLNAYLAIFTIIIIADRGGPMGFGALVLPFLFSYHLFLISAIKEIKYKGKSHKYLTVNCIGLIWILLSTWFFGLGVWPHI